MKVTPIKIFLIFFSFPSVVGFVVTFFGTLLGSYKPVALGDIPTVIRISIAIALIVQPYVGFPAICVGFFYIKLMKKGYSKLKQNLLCGIVGYIATFGWILIVLFIIYNNNNRDDFNIYNFSTSLFRQESESSVTSIDGTFIIACFGGISSFLISAAIGSLSEETNARE
ncbi:hypothetical protein [Stenoxybacter acetivorans]|uniref:hypothetical protein n=1 Tax=Stenoxybacter acetivorans TaxID=422441 RepID=UPI00055BFF19|nr:hypothetical protein [Stenoxybacter acetivorans]